MIQKRGAMCYSAGVSDIRGLYSHAGGVRTLDETYSIYSGYPVFIVTFSANVEVKS